MTPTNTQPGTGGGPGGGTPAGAAMGQQVPVFGMPMEDLLVTVWQAGWGQHAAQAAYAGGASETEVDAVVTAALEVAFTPECVALITEEVREIATEVLQRNATDVNMIATGAEAATLIARLRGGSGR